MTVGGGILCSKSQPVIEISAGRALRGPDKSLYLSGPAFWMSHNDRMQSDRFLRVGSPRDPLFFVTETGEVPIARGRYSFERLHGEANGASDRHARAK